MKERQIIMYDMDMYFAAVMIRENPELKSKPLIIGSKPDERGVVATASYEARKYGVTSGMSSAEAYRKCPNGIFLHPQMDIIIKTTEKIKKIVEEYSDKIEFIALDEGYIDMTNTRQLFNGGDLLKTAKEIKSRIGEETKCTCSVGVGYSKYSAKLAAEENKPDGIGSFTDRKKLLEVIKERKIRVLYGVGEQMEKRLNTERIYKVKDIQEKGIDFMREKFGVYGVFLYYMAWGIDDREIAGCFEEAGVGNSRTLEKNINGLNEIKRVAAGPIRMACYRLKRINKYARNVMVKIRYGDFTTITRSKQLKYPINTPAEVYREVKDILENKIESYVDIRLVGVRLSELSSSKNIQFSLFEEPQLWRKKNSLYDISYKLRENFGYNIVKEAIGMENDKLKGEENDIRMFDAFGDYRTIKALKTLYRKT